ncbi:HNH endonuclease family protein [Rodentibacter trehalosifermentans]|uniref:HNH endonuclease family protein n=1 Tax=Rodentibacter trehalosifermentans TaxID=1908263 RepID=UPI00098728F2|nr:DUF262 domain-containing protein [Rodentibacter trehalosifermentans]OOF48523.1 HNH endonuclease [Rodentibacter trehalosifermentans]
MEIVHKKIKIRELIVDYTDDLKTGRVSGYSGKLDIRPAYQREFVYKDKQRDAVIETIRKGFPLNTIYWAETKSKTFEVLDGQQRTISICQYCNGEFSIDYRAFHNLTIEEQNQILDYELDVYQCSGTDKEKLEWFKVINIAGEKLTNQELRNAIYTGSWLSDAKKRFSAKNCAAEKISKDYLNGKRERQEYLETAIKWISSKTNENIEDYMSKHQHDNNAGELWNYFNSVIEWVKTIFPNYRKEMKSVEWGYLYNEFGNLYPDVDELETQITKLMMDEDVTSKKGVYEYVLSKREKSLSIRAFTPNMKREAYERQEYKCPHCVAKGEHKKWELEEMEADHITPWHLGGKTTSDNCQMLCVTHNRQKSGK